MYMHTHTHTQIYMDTKYLPKHTQIQYGGFPRSSVGKESACYAGGQVWFLGQDDPLEKGMATHSSILAWRIPWTEEPSGLQSMGSQESNMT